MRERSVLLQYFRYFRPNSYVGVAGRDVATYV